MRLDGFGRGIQLSCLHLAVAGQCCLLRRCELKFRQLLLIQMLAIDRRQQFAGFPSARAHYRRVLRSNAVSTRPRWSARRAKTFGRLFQRVQRVGIAALDETAPSD